MALHLRYGCQVILRLFFLRCQVRRLPEPLRVALVEHEQDDAGILGAETVRTATLDTGMPTGSGTGILRTLATGYSTVPGPKIEFESCK